LVGFLSATQAVRQRLQDISLGQGLFSDIVFQLDDGSFAAHRPMLMARCDMMKAMFSGDFRESSAKVVSYFQFTYHIFFITITL
jgi:Rho-related BTB domain-containing protein 1/2